MITTAIGQWFLEGFWLCRLSKRRGKLLFLFFLLVTLSILSTWVYFRAVEKSKEWSPHSLSTYKHGSGMEMLKTRQDVNVDMFAKADIFDSVDFFAMNPTTTRLGENVADKKHEHIKERVTGNRDKVVTEKIRGVKTNESSYEVVRKRKEGINNKTLDLKPSEATPATTASVFQQSDLATCAEYKNPTLIGKLKSLNLSEIQMTAVEQDILGKSLGSVHKLVTDTNQILSKLNRTIPKEYSTSCFKVQSNNKCQNVFPKSVVSAAVEVSHSNYTCMAGGHWRPKDCLPRWKVAIIIPYRDRAFHLPIIIKHLTPFLQRQRLEFGFFVVEQANNLKFNRAMLMNVGFIEAMNFSKWDCFIFHDVDHIPIDDNNYYGCSGMPKHFLSDKLPYSTYFGAVTGFTRGQMFELNGFPNVYWGWGGEDDEIFERTKNAKLTITRVSNKTGRYNVIKHHHQSAPRNARRWTLIKHVKNRSLYDGLTNLKYDEPKITVNPLYTNISVNIQNIPIPGYTPPKLTLFDAILLMWNTFM